VSIQNFCFQLIPGRLQYAGSKGVKQKVFINVPGPSLLIIVTEFWKIIHIGACEIIIIFMFNYLLLRAKHTFQEFTYNFIH